MEDTIYLKIPTGVYKIAKCEYNEDEGQNIYLAEPGCFTIPEEDVKEESYWLRTLCDDFVKIIYGAVFFVDVHGHNDHIETYNFQGETKKYNVMPGDVIYGGIWTPFGFKYIAKLDADKNFQLMRDPYILPPY